MNTNDIIGRQYQSSLKMLEKAIELCPKELWLQGSPNRYWHIAYHALFYTHFYLAPSEGDFLAWHRHRTGYNPLGPAPGSSTEIRVAEVPYTQAELREYAEFCHGEIDRRTPSLDLEAPSGFYWLPFTKLELQFYNIRHLAHHTGQLSERLRSHANIGLPWVR
jgi:hypothetical protein